MSTMGKRTIVVIGGTGMFGGTVVDSLLLNPAFDVRVTTRDDTTERASKVRERGAQIVKADSWKSDELDIAFEGCWGLFLNTDSDDPNFKQEIGPPEFEMGKIVIDAAIRQGVRHFVFSGLPEASRVTGGAVPILSFDNKCAISDYAKQAGFQSAVTVNSGWAMDIFFMEAYGKAFGGFASIPDAEGYLTLKIPPFENSPEAVPWTSLRDDYGDVVHGVLIDPEPWNGQTIWAISYCESFQGVVDTYKRVTGDERARYQVPEEDMSAANKWKAKEVNGLVNYCRFVKGNYCNGSPVDQRPVKVLKELAIKAKGIESSKAQLQTIEGFFRKRIASPA